MSVEIFVALMVNVVARGQIQNRTVVVTLYCNAAPGANERSIISRRFDG